MLDRTTKRLRNAMSLPSILFDADNEESDNLVIGNNPEFKASQEKKEKKRWYSRLPNPGHLLTPLRNSLVKFKRRHDNYEDAGHADENANVGLEVDSKPRKSASDYDVTYVDNDDIPAQTNSPKTDRYSGIIDMNVNSKHLSLNEHIGEARALAHGRVTVKDVFCGRYRKL